MTTDTLRLYLHIKYYITILYMRDDDDDDNKKTEEIGKPTQKRPNPNQTAKTFPFVRAPPLSAHTTSTPNYLYLLCIL